MTTYTWTTPAPFTVGQVVTAADLNPLFHDNMLFLYQSKSARVYQSSGQSLSGAVFTTLLWNAETLDNYSFHSTSSNTGRITAPSGFAGVWRIQATVTFAAIANAQQRILTVNKNGSSSPDAYMQEFATTNVATVVSVETLIILGVGDYIEIRAEPAVALSTVAGEGTTYLNVQWLGASS